ncbi:MAG: hypothetical protein JXR96_03835 [Deltaproteobacteria bacterium]|nr:hypothetical protein [Deltaproteobacteria bacterium]
MRTRAEQRALAVVVLVSVSCLCARARAIWGDSEESFGLDASLRTVTAATVNYDYDPLFGDRRSDGLSQTLLRLTACGRPAGWLSYELHLVQSLDLSTVTGTGLGGPGLFSAGGQDVRFRALDATWSWADEQQVRASLFVDRLNLKFRLPFADLTLGRQAVTFGKAYFWNPLDVFLAFDPRQFDRDYKAGVDALRLDVPLGSFSGVTLVGVLGRRLSVFGSYDDDAFADLSWYGSAVVGRVFTNLLGWDLALQGGKVYGAYQVGGAFSGELWQIALRGELAYFHAQQARDLPLMPGEPEMRSYLSAVVGAGHRFECSLDIELEYLYNGAGDADHLEASLLRMMGGGSLHMGEHLVGLVLTYELLPILNASLAWLFSASDLSSLIQPGLLLSVSNESDFLFGAMIGLGARPTAAGLQSEFGTYPNVYYMEYKFYF